MPSKGGVGLHVAIIMDGNGRWAMRRGLPALQGTGRASQRCGAWWIGLWAWASPA